MNADFFIPQKLKDLASFLSVPLFVVGGYTRNMLINGSVSKDCDIAGAVPCEELSEILIKKGFNVICEYKRTGTLLFSDGERKYEYTRFRYDEYAKGGAHSPEKTFWTDDIEVDARRRDFKCNAVYYDISRGEIKDVLGGVKDIKDRVISTVERAERVFGSDGLRLMRLARFSAELGFTPTEETLNGAREFADNVKDVAPERIWEELKKILVSDTKYPFSDPKGHYTGFKIMEETGVLQRLFPEIAEGKGMSQRMDFHKYDVLEHSLRTLLYAEKEVRLAGFLHDIAKPRCKRETGQYKGHAAIGKEMVKERLKALKADNKTVEECAYLTEWHMFDLDCSESEESVRAFMCDNERYLNKLTALKQADYSAGKDDFSVCPTVEKWERIYAEMKAENAPFSLSDLAIGAEDLKKLGYKGKAIGEELKILKVFAATNKGANTPETLAEKAKKDAKKAFGLDRTQTI